MQDAQTKMWEKSNRHFTPDYNCNSWNYEPEMFENTYPEQVFFNEGEDGQQCYVKDIDGISEGNEHETIQDFKIVATDYDEIVRPQMSVSKKISTRKVPNILKRQRVNQIVPTETDTEPVNSETPLSTETIKMDKTTQEKKSKHHVRKRSRKNNISDSKTEEKKESSSTSANVCVDKLPEFQTFYSLQETEHKILQEQVDYSTNEIFGTYNYELYNTSKLDCFTDYMFDSDETYNSLSTIHDSESYQKEYDINDNEIDNCSVTGCSSLQFNQYDETVLINQSVLPSKYWYNLPKNFELEDVPILNDEDPNCSSDISYDYSLENCTSNSMEFSRPIHHTPIKNKVLTETVNDNSIHMAHNTNYQVHFNYMDSRARKEEHVDITSLTLNNETSQCENIELPSTEVMFHDEKSIGKNVFVESTNTASEKNVDERDDLDELDYVLSMFQEQMKNNSDKNTLQSRTNKKSETIAKKFQCLLCPITFSNTRTLAMHQAGAHGGTYIILCESCGRLFNRKYHYNRHFIHCGRLKEPYKCDMCMKTYRHKSSLVHHLKMVHQVQFADRSAKFTCNECKKVYSKFGAFENHVKRHKENVCHNTTSS